MQKEEKLLIGKRFKEAILQKYSSISEYSRIIGKSPQVLNDYFNGRLGLTSINMLSKIKETFLDLEYILTGIPIDHPSKNNFFKIKSRFTDTLFYNYTLNKRNFYLENNISEYQIDLFFWSYITNINNDNENVINTRKILNDSGINLKYILEGTSIDYQYVSEVLEDNNKKYLENMIPVLYLNDVVSAGSGAFTSNNKRIIHVPIELISSIKNPAIVKVSGDSMLPIIATGDNIIYEQTNICKNGDTIICTYDDVAYIKKFIKTPKNLCLRSFNVNYKDINIINSSENFIIHGVVKKIIKNL